MLSVFARRTEPRECFWTLMANCRQSCVGLSRRESTANRRAPRTKSNVGLRLNNHWCTRATVLAQADGKDLPPRHQEHHGRRDKLTSVSFLRPLDSLLR